MYVPQSTEWERWVSSRLFKCLLQGRRHEILFGGTESWAPKPTYPQKLVSPRISATLFWKHLKMQKFHTCQEKNIMKYLVTYTVKISSFLGGGRPPQISRLGGRVPPFPGIRHPWFICPSIPANDLRTHVVPAHKANYWHLTGQPHCTHSLGTGHWYCTVGYDEVFRYGWRVSVLWRHEWWSVTASTMADSGRRRESSTPPDGFSSYRHTMHRLMGPLRCRPMAMPAMAGRDCRTGGSGGDVS